jgi:hypothetical protein
MQNSFEETAAFGLSGSELRFQPIAHGHQFIDFEDDAVLFGERWNVNEKIVLSFDRNEIPGCLALNFVNLTYEITPHYKI